MKNIFTIGGKLALICAVAAIVLGFVNSFTEPAIEQNRKQELADALKTVVTEGKIGEEQVAADVPEIVGYYPVTSSNDKTIGFALKLLGSGYGGDMNILTYYSTEGEVLSVVLMENGETPGLGKMAEKKEYMEKFIGTGALTPLPVRKDQLPQAEADAITGATVTFMGIAKALEAGSLFVSALGEEK